VIAPNDLTGVDEDLARRILVTARSIAPCLDTLDDADPSEPRSAALAILKGVAKNGGNPHGIKSQRVGPAAVEYNASSWWSDDDRAALRSLCVAPDPLPGMPVGSVPKTSQVVSRMFPEDC